MSSFVKYSREEMFYFKTIANYYGENRPQNPSTPNFIDEDANIALVFVANKCQQSCRTHNFFHLTLGYQLLKLTIWNYWSSITLQIQVLFAFKNDGLTPILMTQLLAWVDVIVFVLIKMFHLLIKGVVSSALLELPGVRMLDLSLAFLTYFYQAI